MDFNKPNKLPKNYFFDTFNKKSKNDFTSEIMEKCKDKEDPEMCQQKYLAAFDSVFATLQEKLEDEARMTYNFENRLYKAEGLASYNRMPYKPQYH